MVKDQPAVWQQFYLLISASIRSVVVRGERGEGTVGGRGRGRRGREVGRERLRGGERG